MYEQTPDIESATAAVPWNRGKLIGQKPPLTLKQAWAIRMRLPMDQRVRDLALFNLAIDSKLRGCDLVRLRVRDVVHGDQVVSRATVMQRKTGQPARFEVTEQTRDAVRAWIAERKLSAADFLFPSRIRASRHLSTRQYARIVRGWVALIGLDTREYGTHSLRRTKATLIYRRTKNLRAVQLLLGHANIQSTVRCLGLEVDDELEIAEHTEI
jgi:integrase